MSLPICEGPANVMSTTVSMSVARATFATLITRVVDGEEITLSRRGVPVAVMVRPPAIKNQHAHPSLVAASALHELLAAGRNSRPSTNGSISAERADEMVKDLRANRSSR